VKEHLKRRLIAKFCSLLGNRLLNLYVDVRILTGCSEIAVSAHAQYKIGWERHRTTGTTPSGSSCNAWQVWFHMLMMLH